MTIVLDTSALIYWTLDPAKLTPDAANAIAAATRIVVSSISIWEIGIKVQKGKLTIPLPIDQFAGRLQTVRGVELLAVDTETWLANIALSWSHRDPADRTIVATAMLLGAPLITSDRAIKRFYAQTIW
ncbi:MAG: type II toxin-antitoxin system VapC family toxin [Ardenticatenaceae bacterium]